MPFGLVNSRGMLVRALRRILRDIHHTENYIGYIIINTKRWDKLPIKLEKLLRRLRKRPFKCEFAKKNIEFLRGNIGVQKQNTNKIRDNFRFLLHSLSINYQKEKKRYTILKNE